MYHIQTYMHQSQMLHKFTGSQVVKHRIDKTGVVIPKQGFQTQLSPLLLTYTCELASLIGVCRTFDEDVFHSQRAMAIVTFWPGVPINKIGMCVTSVP